MANFKFLEESYGLKKIAMYAYAGQIDSYYTVANYDVNSKKFVTTISAYKYDSVDELIALLNSRSYGKAKAKVEGNTIVLTFSVPFSTTKMKEIFDESIDPLIRELKAREFTSGSFLTGMDDGTISLVRVGPDYVFLTESDHHAYAREMEEYKAEIRDSHENFILGIIGILISAAVGGAVHFLFFKAGYYVFIVPLAMSSFAYILYKKLAGRTSIFTIFAMLFILLPTIFGCLLIEYSADIIEYYGIQGVSFFSVVEDVWDMVKDFPDVRNQFIKDFLLNGGLLLLGILGTYFSTYKKERQFHTISKVE